MQGFRLITKISLWCLAMVFISSVWARHADSQEYNLAMSNLTGMIQDTPAGETAYCHYSVTNTGNGTDDIYLSSEIITSTNGTWTVLLVPFQGAAPLVSPQRLEANQSLSFYLKVIPPTDAISGSCTIKVVAVNSYFHEHSTGDGWPVGGDADVQQDINSIRLISPILTISSTTPSEGSLVLIETLIEAVFNMDPARWKLMMTLQDELSMINVAGRVILQNNKLCFIPNTPLLASKSYKVTISGSEFVSYEWRFKTMAEKEQIKQADGIQNVINYPNPFNMTTDSCVTFGLLPINETVTIEIYTLDGKLVRTLIAQNGTCIWDGQNKNGDKISSGVYIYMVKMKTEKKIDKITVIK